MRKKPCFGSAFKDSILLLILFAVLAIGCVGPSMTVEEAKEVAITIEKEPFVPPPRRIYDVLSVLEQGGTFNPKIIAKHKEQLASQPPETDKAATLAGFYLKRGHSALEFGYPHQAVVDLRTGLQLAEQVKNFDKMGSLLFRLGQAELLVGNFRQGVTLLERGKRLGKGAAFNELVKIYSYIGDIEQAKQNLDAGTRELNHKLEKSMRKKKRNQGGGKKGLNKDSRREATRSQMTAWFLEGQGKFAEAEPYIRSALKVEESQRNRFPGRSTQTRISLANNLMMQGRIYEAEVEMRKALDSALGFGGRESILTATAVNALGNVILSQGRVEEAEKLAQTGIQILRQCGITAESKTFSDALMVLGDVLAAKGNFENAAARFDEAAKGNYKSPHLYDRLHRNPNYILSLIQTGRLNDALKIIHAVYPLEKNLFGADHPSTLEIVALGGMIQVKTKQYDQAYKDLAASVPLLLERKVDEKNFSEKVRYKIIGETFLDLLSELNGSALEAEMGINAVSEAFQLADTLGGRSLQRSLGASGARAAVSDPRLADLVRKEQDSLKQLEVLQVSLSNMMAAPLDQQMPRVIKDLQDRIAKLKKARTVLYREIESGFPKYTDFSHPHPGTISNAKEKLLPEESIIMVYTAADKTYIWAVPALGNAVFWKTSIGAKEMARIIAQIRQAASPNLDTFGDIPPFDVATAHDLFARVLQPVDTGWKYASELLVVAYGPMGQIPFGMLPTKPAPLSPDKNLLFSNYRSIPWLIRKTALTRIPSVSSLLMLRSLPEISSNRKAFIGFGNPIFNLSQYEESTKRQIKPLSRGADPILQFQNRGFRKKSDAPSDNQPLSSLRLEDLTHLPDTEKEIKHIAMALDADLKTDVRLRADASEQEIKSLDLSDRKVIAFATHALRPGDLDGLDQSALALSSPNVTGETEEDGLLTAGEIYNLKLNADWVVLSACSTGFDSESGAQSVSGLGRAFFYAGTRSLLVTLWPVETTSARKLTTRLFGLQNKNPSLSRAKALQLAMVDLMDGPGLADPSTDRTVCSYAHPFFWAPFIIIGESGHVAG